MKQRVQEKSNTVIILIQVIIALTVICKDDILPKLKHKILLTSKKFQPKYILSDKAYKIYFKYTISILHNKLIFQSRKKSKHR